MSEMLNGQQIQVYHYDWSKGNNRRKSTLQEYHKHETSTLEVTHTQVFKGRLIHYLTTFGMDTWVYDTEVQSDYEPPQSYAQRNMVTTADDPDFA